MNEQQSTSQTTSECATIEAAPGANLMLVNLDGVPEHYQERLRDEAQEAAWARDTIRLYKKLRPKLGYEGAFKRISELLPVSKRKARRFWENRDRKVV